MEEEDVLGADIVENVHEHVLLTASIAEKHTLLSRRCCHHGVLKFGCRAALVYAEEIPVIEASGCRFTFSLIQPLYERHLP